MRPKVETRKRPLFDSRGRVDPDTSRPSDTEYRAICGCGYPTSWVLNRASAETLYDYHRAAHGAVVV